MEATDDGSAPIGLGLGLQLGPGSATCKLNTCFTQSSGFTIFQLQELQLQSLIYKYMEAGVPVPLHLVIPIWNSVAASLSAFNAAFYPTLSAVFGFGTLSLDRKNGMDPEPGRCRRTDGKKWRCSKEAVPDHKYCERHMHRGRHRSRKLVEASSQVASNARSGNEGDGENLFSISGFSTRTVLHSKN